MLWPGIKRGKPEARGSSKGITAGKAVVQLQKQEITVLDNNAIRLQVSF